ncbi:MAG: NADH-quinone oxidoreductase subunit NuoF [Candidatus Acetothermia bacterium]|nr:NADH-quinone oxidoreductase subunit NuoF [Candidatus Acetothermia bacterium]MDH7504637.1 NADH-quinone oxidoreductase subunit NuoF [Candidatus Acetothermia bacterium]
MAGRRDLEKLRIQLLKQTPSSRPCITISSGTCGRARGSEKVGQAFREALRKHGLDGKVTIRVSGCHGFCQAEPHVLVHPEGIFYQRLRPEDAEEIVVQTLLHGRIIDRLLYVDPATGKKSVYEGEIPFYKRQQRNLLASNALLDPTSIDDYIAIGGYTALAKALTTMRPEEVIEEIKRSGLRGRGGAGFPTGIKWELCRRSPGDQKYVICNADEGDPGAYMDRSLLEGNPHSVIEGMIIGAYAIGASYGFIYVRAEYPLAVKHVGIALEQAREYGLLGEDILASGFDFDLKVVRGAGAFVCGEETALMASIEGRKGEPRQRPPFPVQKGLWGKPTNINNVETWANVPLIINRGAEWYASIGTERSKGTKIFSLVGKINNTGLVEVPMGITLKEIIYDIGGGIPKGKKFKAVQTGGPSGGCIPAELLDLPVDYEKLAEAGSMMGSGGMVVMDEDTCMVDVARYFLDFLRDESCGKCLSCREGTQRMFEILTAITEGRGKEGDLELLEELALVVKETSMCGLGQTAPNPVLSTLRHFRDEYEAHIKYKRCPAAVCKELISSPCQHICPIGTEVPVYVALIAQGRFAEALEVIRKDNPLPSVCGRVCHHPCEAKCRAGEGGEPIAIRALKRFATDYGLREGLEPQPSRGPGREEKVAVIGSGPAGLSCAAELAKLGYPVTVFEALPVAGGMLAVGIPEYRLPKRILQADIRAIESLGVEIKTNTALGREITLDGLFAQGYKAIFIAIGAHKSLKLGLPGEEAEGVLPAMDFLTAVNLGKKVQLGPRVGIIGGGNAAVDAARVARRLLRDGEVTIIYRRTRAEMPAYPEEVEAALEEGIAIEFLAAPVEILSSNGKLEGVKLVRMELGEVDETGRRRPIPIPGSEFTLELDTLIAAIGEEPEIPFQDGQVRVSKWKTIEVDPETFATGRPGVFAGGDVVSGPGTVIEAIAAGKVAAQSIDSYLRGLPLTREYRLTRPSVYIPPVELSEEEVIQARRPAMPLLRPEERASNFKEVELGLTEEQAIKEARRCLRCDLETKEGKAAISGRAVEAGRA